MHIHNYIEIERIGKVVTKKCSICGKEKVTIE